MGGWVCLILSINREPTSGSVVDHYHQLMLFNAAHQITTQLPVISTYTKAWRAKMLIVFQTELGPLAVNSISAQPWLC
jgi:hypothetical protein